MPFFVETQVGDITGKDSISGYEIIEYTEPYRDYKTIDEYEMMSDLHSNILHDGSNFSETHSICSSKSGAGASGNIERYSKTETSPQNTNMISSNMPQTASYTESPEKTKPVYRKTPVPCRRMTRISTDSDLTLLPYFERDQAGRDNKLKISGKSEICERGLSSLQLIV